jgi:periplasmic divalent cation tolerance protein
MGAPAPTDARVVLVTAPDERVARELARALVERGLAACVNVIPQVASIYRWQGAVEEASEVLMLVKTSAARVAEIERFLDEEHPYDVPECVALEPRHVEAKYLRWLIDESAAR